MTFSENIGQMTLEVNTAIGANEDYRTTPTPNGVQFYLPLAGDYIIAFKLSNGMDLCSYHQLGHQLLSSSPLNNEAIVNWNIKWKIYNGNPYPNQMQYRPMHHKQHKVVKE